MSLNIRQNLLPSSKYPVKSPYTMTPTRIVIHNTANDASASNEIAYMVRNDLEVSFHYAVDDIEAVQGLPENRNGWHAGDGRTGIGNRQGIGIEICYSKSGGDRFIQAERNGAKLTAMLLKKYGWGIAQVTKHQDYSGKYCPHRTLDMGWQRFLNMVQAELDGGTDWKTQVVKLPDDKKVYKTNKNTALVNMDTGAVVKDFPEGSEITMDYEYKSTSGTVYLMTAYSFDRNIKNGIRKADLTLVKEPEPEIPTPPPVDNDKEIIKQLEAEIVSLKNDLGTANDTIKSRDSEIIELKQDIKERDGQIEEKDKTITRLENDNKEAVKKMKECEDKLENANTNFIKKIVDWISEVLAKITSSDE